MIGGVKKVGSVGSRVWRVNGYIEPFAGLGPANIGQVSRRNNLVEGVVVNLCGLPFELRIGSIHSLMEAKFIEVGPIGRIQLSTAVILWIAVVIRHPFA